jgi:hypothetical protein
MIEIQTIFIWVVVGTWICYKRNWYKDAGEFISDDTPNFVCCVTIIFAPIALVIALFDVFIKNSWKK